MKRFRMGMAVAAILTAGLTSLYAAGNWSTLPIVGGASFCSGTSTGFSGTVCNVTVPAGPTGLTGNELIPADTVLSGGAPPQTVTIQSVTLGGGAKVFADFPTGLANTATITPSAGKVILRSSGTISSATLNMPASAIDGYRLNLSSTQSVTTLVMTDGNNGLTYSIDSSPTAITKSTTASYGYAFIYNAANTTWYRLQ